MQTARVSDLRRCKIARVKPHIYRSDLWCGLWFTIDPTDKRHVGHSPVESYQKYTEARNANS